MPCSLGAGLPLTPPPVSDNALPAEAVNARLSLGWPMRSTMFLHLVWQGWRQMWVNLLIILGSLLLVAIWMYFALVLQSNRETLSRRSSSWRLASPY